MGSHSRCQINQNNPPLPAVNVEKVLTSMTIVEENAVSDVVEHEAQQPTAKDETSITLISRDGLNFEVPKSAALLSEFIKDTLDIDDEDDEPDSYQPVHVLRVDGDCLQKVVDFLCHYKHDPLPEIRQPLVGNSLQEVRKGEWTDFFREHAG
jgi:Skp1 family, tetramerisation domain